MNNRASAAADRATTFRINGPGGSLEVTVQPEADGSEPGSEALPGHSCSVRLRLDDSSVSGEFSIAPAALRDFRKQLNDPNKLDAHLRAEENEFELRVAETDAVFARGHLRSGAAKGEPVASLKTTFVLALDPAALAETSSQLDALLARMPTGGG